MADMQKDMGMAIHALRERLESSGISTSEWGKGTAKTLSDLAIEIETGETALVEGSDGKLSRNVVVGCADIFYNSPTGERYKLKEEKQVFTDGRERVRDLEQSVSEKLKPGENPAQSMARGIEEELGISGALNLISRGASEESLSSPSYPGLNSTYVTHKFETTFNDDQYKPEGYKEVQPTKTTYFIWGKI